MYSLFKKYYLLLFGLIYIFFSTNNSTLDAWFFAAQVKNNGDIFQPHHLLYNAFSYCILQILIFCKVSVDVLFLMKIINAIFAILILWLLKKIIQELHINISLKEQYIYSVFIGFSFSFWRFSTENETYIIPIFFSLLASFYFLKYQLFSKNKYLIISSLMASLACLFHQIHFWWWLGLLLGLLFFDKNITTKIYRKVFLFIFPALLVPFIYFLVLYQRQGNVSMQIFIQFIFHDFYSGDAYTSFSIMNFVMTGINIIRSFIQIHGLILALIKTNILWITPAILASIFFIYGLFKIEIEKNKNINYSFIKTHIIVVLFHILFAIYAVGNVEFMVMIPLLVILTIVQLYKINIKSISLFALSLFIWNFAYGIFPNYYYDLQQEGSLVRRVVNQPNDLFVIADKTSIENKIYYQTGRLLSSNLKSIPTHIIAKHRNIHQLKFQIDSTLQASGRVYTDALHRQTVFSRASLIFEEKDSLFFSSYSKQTLIDSTQTLLGKSYLIEISR